MSTEKKKINLTPLNENESGQIEGGFSEIPTSSRTDTEELNTGCALNVVMCGCYPTTKPPPPQ